MAKSLVTTFVFAICAVIVFTQESQQTKWEKFKSKIECGKSKPGEDDPKCHKYGTDSGFKCCWIKSGSEPEICRLVSYGELETLKVKGEKQEYTFDDGEKLELSCSSSYIKLISTSVILVLVSLIMF